MRCLIVGDVHLGKGISIGRPGIGNALNSRIQDQMKLLDWVVDQAIDNNVDTVVFTGDICEDSKPDYILVEIFLEILKKLEVYNIGVIIVGGNHDMKRTGGYYKSFLDIITAAELPFVSVYKHIHTMIKDNVGLVLLPFRDRRSLDCKTDNEAFDKISSLLVYAKESIPSTCKRVLIGHLALHGSIFVGDEFDNESNELMCPIDMFVGFDYVWMGHVHKPQVKSKFPHVAHIGSLDISDFGEADHKKVIVLFDSYGDFKEIEVPTRSLCNIQVDVPEGFSSTAYVIDKIKAVNKKTPIKNAIVRIEIKLLDEDTENINRQAVENVVYDLGAYHICNLSESRNISVVSIVNKCNIDNKIDTRAAIKIWSEHDTFDDKKEKSEYIDLANKFVDDYETKYS